jgi:hypothetical protein
MKKLTELYLFNSLPDGTRNAMVRDMTNEMLIDNHGVPMAKIQEQVTTIQRRYKYASRSKIVDELTKGELVPVFDEKMVVPAFVPAWLVYKAGKIVGVANISLHAKQQGQFLEIDNKRLFGLLQDAVVLRGLHQNQNKITNNMTVVKASSSVYTRMFVRCLDRLYSLNLEPVQADKASYLVSKFFLLYVLGKADSESVKGVALKAAVNETPVSVIERVEDENEVDFSSLDGFVESLGDAVPTLRNLNVRSLAETWTRMYGDSTILGIESFQYFTTAIFSAATASGLNNEAVINNLASKDVQSFYLEFFRVVR